MARFLKTLFLVLVVSIAYADTLVLKVPFTGEVSEDKKTQFVLDLLKSTKGNTEVYLYVTSPGGSTDIGYKIIAAMQHNGSTDTVVVTKYAYSMAAMWVCGADRFIVDDNAELMFHMAYYYDDQGRIVRITPQSDPKLWRLIDQTLHRCPFLTEDDIRRIDNGGEVWLTGKDIKKRMRGA